MRKRIEITPICIGTVYTPHGQLCGGIWGYRLSYSSLEGNHLYYGGEFQEMIAFLGSKELSLSPDSPRSFVGEGQPRLVFREEIYDDEPENVVIYE